MKEIQDIIQAFDNAQQQGRQTALATVVHVEGSSYRRAGARMLVTDNGQLTGAISGGCLEGDALRKAQLVMSRQQPMLVTYDTTDEDDAKLGVGLGCEGIIHIMIEPVDTSKPGNPIQLLKTIAAQRQKAVLVTIFSLQDKKGVQPGTCMVQLQDGTIIGEVTDPLLRDAITVDVQQAMHDQYSATKTYLSGAFNSTVFVEFIAPVISLVIAGAGNDTMPLVKMAAVMGWQITVADGRINYAPKERFPAANKILVGKPDKLLPQLVVDEQTVFVLMTHNYNYDLAMMRQLLLQPVTYIGVLGPKKKLVKMLDELKEQGVTVREEQLSIIHGPVGFDIGAETAEEIALSILAEIKAVLAGKAGTSLRHSNEAIHPQTRRNIPEVVLRQMD
jgi:xanthine/CO dehydrogenase XdhC/CoxF family maturation factor